MKRDEILRRANEIVSEYGLKAEFLGGTSVGVGGDDRTYLPIIVLVGSHPGWDILEKVSSAITNTLPINKVTFETARNK